MPMTNDQRRAYLQRAGVTQEQIDETVGELPIQEDTVQALQLSRADAERARGAAEQARGGIRQVLADAAIISAKYSAVAQASAVARANERGAGAVDPDEVVTDSRILDELFADEYTLFNACGDALDRAQVTDAMLKGMIQFDGMGRAGFEAISQSLQVRGDTAVATGDYQLEATGQARNTETGEVYRQDLRGLHRVTNTYVFRNNRWQATHTQMTRVPADRNWRFTVPPAAVEAEAETLEQRLEVRLARIEEKLADLDARLQAWSPASDDDDVFSGRDDDDDAFSGRDDDDDAFSGRDDDDDAFSGRDEQ
jgi:Domain of unknown function (DUF4440)